MTRDRKPKPGEFYRHFKNHLYQIITVAVHSETGEEMVVYQALYGDFKTYVRPLGMFLDRVDKDKYPNIRQTYRFELVNMEEEGLIRKTEYEPEYRQEFKSEYRQGFKSEYKTENILVTNDLQQNVIPEEEYNKEQNDQNSWVDRINYLVKNQPDSETLEPDVIHSVLLEFLDAKSYQEKLAILTHKKKYVTDKIINDMAVSLDCTVDEGSIEDRINGLIICLQTLARFENKRLR